MISLKVTGMTCDHCVRAVGEAVRAVPGAGDVSVDLRAGQVTIGGSPDPQAVRRAIEEEGYGVQPAG
jgi:copper chaperone